MKQKWLYGFIGLISMCGVALALQTTRTPPIAPETGENSLSQQEIVNVARFKPGFCALAVTVSGSAGSGTCNNAAGLVSLSAATAGASGATPSVITVTNNKAQLTTDAVLCTVDQNGATSGSVPTCSPHISAAGTIVFTISNASSTALTSSSIKFTFLILTSGNPN